MNWIVCLLLGLTPLAPPENRAQAPLRVGSPASVGVDAAQLDAAIGLFRDAVAADALKGAVLLVARDGVVVAHEAMGLRSVEHRLAMERDSLFRMASNTKPIVAAGILTLVEEGRLRLDDRVGRHLKSFARGASAKVTVHHLLTHTSGFRIPGLFLNPLEAKSADHPDRPNLQREVDRFADVGPEVEPGTSYAYSNAGYNILGALIEVVSGQPLEVFLTERFYRPLGMWDTTHRGVAAKGHRSCEVWRKEDDVWKRRWSPGDAPHIPFVRASGGLISTAADYARFCQMMLEEGTFGGERILSPESVALATQPHTKLLYSAKKGSDRKSFYGYGWSIDPDGIFSHSGSDGTHAFVDPAHRLIGIVLTQSTGGKNPREEFKRRVIRACAPVPTISKLNERFLADDLDVDDFVKRFEGESREIARARNEIVSRLELREGMAIADIGAGTGLFLTPFMSSVGPAGKVYAVDISPKFVDHLTARIASSGQKNVEPVLCTDRSTMLRDGTVDIAFVCDTYHHFDYPHDTLRSLYRAIRPGGALVVIDFERIVGVSTEWTLNHVRAGKEVFRGEIEVAGFVFEREDEVPGLDDNYMIRFVRPTE